MEQEEEERSRFCSTTKWSVLMLAATPAVVSEETHAEAEARGEGSIYGDGSQIDQITRE